MRSFTKILSLVLAAFCLFTASAKAHTVWVMAEQAEPGKDGVVILGYGHTFPLPEPIAPERAHIFKTPVLVAPGGETIALRPTDESFRFTTDGAPLAEGSYLVLGEYQPTIWTTTRSDGSQMAAKNAVSGSVVSSYRVATYAKAVVNVGDAAGDDATRVVGTVLEIVPQTNPAAVNVGERLRVQVLFEGKPLAGTWVYGITEDYGHGLHDAKAFANKTDKNGYIDFVPWKAGLWQLEVDKRVDLEDTTTHDYDDWRAKLCFEIK